MKKLCKGRPRTAALLIIILIVLLLELTLWNRPYYAHFWQGPESTDFTIENINISGRIPDDGEKDGAQRYSSIAFQNLDMRVNSIYVEPAPGSPPNPMKFLIIYGDEDASQKQTSMTVIPGFERSYYQEINPYGKTDHVFIIPNGNNYTVSHVAVNKTIPFSFNISRVLLFILLAFGVFSLITSDICKTPFSPANRRQTLILISGLVLFSVLTLLISSSTPYHERTGPYANMVDSFLEGRLDLGIDPPPALLDMENPYDYAARQQLGLATFNEDPDSLIWDNAYKDGKFYMQHGVVPTILLYLPYHLLTGDYMNNGIAVWIFVVICGIFLALIWRKIVLRFLGEMPFVMYMCTTAAVLFMSMITCTVWAPMKHEVSAASAMMFAALGLWLLLPPDTTKKTSFVNIFFGALCLALAVGCRPIFLLVSILVPFILWRHLSERKQGCILKFSACVAIPYIAVAIPLMCYNYARFGNVFDFGTYIIYHSPNAGQLMNMNPMGILHVFFIGLKNLFFSPLSFVAGFPFSLNSGAISLGSEYPARYYHYHAGLINFPIIWAFAGIPLLRKKIASLPKRMLATLLVMLLLGVFMNCYAATTTGMSIRYQIDCMWLFTFPALLCVYWLWERFNKNSALAKIICAVCIFSAAVALILPSEGVPFESLNPDAYFSLKDLFLPFG